MYKLIAIDLDGTMLNTYGEVTDKTKNDLKNRNNKSIYKNGKIRKNLVNTGKYENLTF